MDTETETIEPDPMNADPQRDTSGLPPPLPPPSPRPPRLSWWQVPVARDQDNKKVSGVISGLCRAYGFDVKTTRIAVAIATLIFPAVLAFYVAALILLPDRPEEAAPLRDVVTDRRRMPLVLVIGVIVLAASFGSFGTWFLFGGFGWGFALIALGVVLWLGPTWTSRDRPTPDPEMGASEPAAPLTPAASIATVIDAPPLPAATKSDRERSSRRRVPIASIAFLVATAVAIVASIGDALNWWDTNVLGVTIAVLIILTVGLIATVAVNRFWLAVPLAMLCLFSIGVLLVVRPNLNGGIGERTVTPTEASAIQHEQLAIGTLTLDLTEIPIGAETITASAEVGVGELHVVVPNSVEVRVDAYIGAGVLSLDGDDLATGVRQDDQRSIKPIDDDETQTGTISLELDVGAGVIRIETTGS